MFGNLFKSKRNREIERDVRIKQSLLKQKQAVAKLEKHEREYMEKALQAKRNGDTANFRRLCAMAAKTANFKHGIQSFLLHFETMMQTRDMAQTLQQFAGGAKEITRSISEAFAGINVAEMFQDFDTAIAQSSELETVMSTVLDKISSVEPDSFESGGGISAEDVERTLNEKAALEDKSLDRAIDASLAELRNTMKEKA